MEIAVTTPTGQMAINSPTCFLTASPISPSSPDIPRK